MLIYRKKIVFTSSKALVTVWRVVSHFEDESEGDSYWKLGIGIIILFCDGLHALCNRKVSDDSQGNIFIFQ